MLHEFTEPCTDLYHPGTMSFLQLGSFQESRGGPVRKCFFSTRSINHNKISVFLSALLVENLSASEIHYDRNSNNPSIYQMINAAVRGICSLYHPALLYCSSVCEHTRHKLRARTKYTTAITIKMDRACFSNQITQWIHKTVNYALHLLHSSIFILC